MSRAYRGCYGLRCIYHSIEPLLYLIGFKSKKRKVLCLHLLDTSETISSQAFSCLGNHPDAFDLCDTYPETANQSHIFQVINRLVSPVPQLLLPPCNLSGVLALFLLCSLYTLVAHFLHCRRCYVVMCLLKFDKIPKEKNHPAYRRSPDFRRSHKSKRAIEIANNYSDGELVIRPAIKEPQRTTTIPIPAAAGGGAMTLTQADTTPWHVPAQLDVVHGTVAPPPLPFAKKEPSEEEKKLQESLKATGEELGKHKAKLGHKVTTYENIEGRLMESFIEDAFEARTALSRGQTEALRHIENRMTDESGRSREKLRNRGRHHGRRRSRSRSRSSDGSVHSIRRSYHREYRHSGNHGYQFDYNAAQVPNYSEPPPKLHPDPAEYYISNFQRPASDPNLSRRPPLEQHTTPHSSASLDARLGKLEKRSERAKTLNLADINARDMVRDQVPREVMREMGRPIPVPATMWTGAEPVPVRGYTAGYTRAPTTYMGLRPVIPEPVYQVGVPPPPEVVYEQPPPQWGYSRQHYQ
jgi:hypothetical protein